jgi:TP901 family phage tail tape measure protein
MPGKEITIRVVLDDRDAKLPNVNKAKNDLADFGNSARSVGLALTAGITVPLGLIAKEVLRVGTEYQNSMNLFQANTRATAAEMVAAGNKAKQLGADLSLPTTSAGNAGRAMNELAKTGLNVQQAMDAARGTLLLAAAAQIDEARAAEITGNALNTFSLRAEESARVTDLLAASASASSAEITDIAQAMQQSGASAAALKIPIEDLVTGLGEMANAGIKGSDAGTSFKTMLAALTPNTDKAAVALKELGINAFDSEGRFVGLKTVIEQAQPALARMTDEQKALAIETAFGSDAQRAANILLGKGVEAWDSMYTAVNRAGAAQDLAAARTKGLTGAWEGLKSQLETGAIVLFERMSPTLEKIVRDLAEFASSTIDSATAFAKANPGLADFAIKLGVALAAIGPLALGIAGVVSAIGLLSGPALAIGGVLLGIGAGAAAASAALGAMSGSYKELSGTTAAQVIESYKLVDVHKKEIANLETLARKGYEQGDSYKQILETYKNLDPVSRARVDLLISESKETGELTKLSHSLIQVKKELLEQDKQAAKIQLAQLAKDFFTATENLAKAQEKVAELGRSFDSLTKYVRDYQEMQRQGKLLTEDQLIGLDSARQQLSALPKQYADATSEARKYQAEVKGTGEQLHILSEALGVSNREIVQNAQTLGAASGDMVDSLNALSRAGVQGADAARKFSAAWVDAQEEAKKAGKAIGQDLVSGFVVGISSFKGKSLDAVTQWMKDANTAMRAEARAKSPAETTIELAKDIADGLIVGFKAKASDVAKATRELIKSALDDVRTASAEAVALANASLKTLQYLKQAEDAREFIEALTEIRKLRREIGQDETTAIPRTRELALLTRQMLQEQARNLADVKKKTEEQATALLDLTENTGDLLNAELSLARDRRNWADQQTQRWLESQRQTEQVIQGISREQRIRSAAIQEAVLGQRKLADEIISTRAAIENISIGSIERIKLAELNARLEILQADDKARQSIVASRVYIADQTVFHSDRATASILGHLAKQKGVTESVADAFIGLYDNVFGKLNGLIDGWTSKLGIFGDFVGTIFKGIVNNIANNVLGSLFGQNGLLSGIVNRIGGTLGNVLGGILGTGGGGAGGAAGGIGNIVGGILGIGGGATGGATSGVLGGILGALGIGGTASIAGGTTALAGGAVGLSTIGAGAAGLSGISTTTALGTAAGAGTGGIGGVLGSIGAFATSGLGIATFGIGTAVAVIGTYLLKRAKQRRNDEEASGVALQDAVDLIKNTASEIDADKLRFGTDADSQTLLNDGILGPFKNFINTLKTASVRDSRLTNQVRDLENLYNELVGAAIKRQQERLAAAAANPTTTTTGTTGTSDPFAGFTATPTTISLDLVVRLEQGTDAATKAFVVSAKTKEGRDVVVETVKIAESNGEL